MGSCCSGTFHSYNPHEVDLTHFEMMKVVGRGGFGKVNVVCKLDTRELLAMKRIDKSSVVAKQSHIDMLWVERNIMAKVTSPFLCHLIYAFQSPSELFLVMPFMQGGDLRYHLKERAGAMTEPVCRYYCAEIILALEALHGANILYRDMKPDNILLDGEGHLRLSDFGISVELSMANNMRTRGRAGTRGYQAPELFDNQTYGFSCDIFSFGVTIYELLHGTRPFNSKKMNQQVASAERFPTVRYKTRLSVEAKSLLAGMLTIDPARRLGCGPGGLQEIKSHPWFADVNWVAMARKEIDPPIKPDTTKANCSSDFDLEEQLSEEPPRLITKEQQRHFEGFEYHTRIGPNGRPLPDPPPPPRYVGISPTIPHPPVTTTMSGDGAATPGGAAPSPTGRLTPSMNNYLMDSRLEKASPRSLSFTRTRSGFETGPSSRVNSPLPGALLSPSSANNGALGSGAQSPIPTSPGQEGKRSMRRAHLSSQSHSNNNTGGGPNNSLPGGASGSIGNGSAPHSPLHPSGLRMSSGPLPASVLLGVSAATVPNTPGANGTPILGPSPPMPPHSLQVNANVANNAHGGNGATSPHGSSLGAGVRSPSLSLSPRAKMRTSSQLPPSLSNAHLPLPTAGSTTSLNVQAALVNAQASISPPVSQRTTRPPLVVGVSANDGSNGPQGHGGSSPPDHMRHLAARRVTSHGGTLSGTNTMVEAHPFGAPDGSLDGLPPASPSLGPSTVPASPMHEMTPSLGPTAIGGHSHSGGGACSGGSGADLPDLHSRPLVTSTFAPLPAYTEGPLVVPAPTGSPQPPLATIATTSSKRPSSHLVSYMAVRPGGGTSAGGSPVAISPRMQNTTTPAPLPPAASAPGVSMVPLIQDDPTMVAALSYRTPNPNTNNTTISARRDQDEPKNTLIQEGTTPQASQSSPSSSSAVSLTPTGAAAAAAAAVSGTLEGEGKIVTPVA